MTCRLLVLALAAATLLFGSGCATTPADAFALPPSTLADRQMQSRRFQTLDETHLLNSGIGVLQDLGYVIDEANSELGVLTASKTVDAEQAGQVVGLVFLALLTGSTMDIDDDQIIRVCLVLQPSLEEKGWSVARITMQRTVMTQSGRVSRVESIKVPELYQAFFDKLSKATFLEAQEL